MTTKKTKKPRRVYKDADGNKLPSVTEILGGLGWKYPALMAWANKLGREGKTLNEGSRDAMEIGTVAHDLIENYILGRSAMERGDIALDIWEPACLCLSKFDEWWTHERMDERFQLLATECLMVDHQRGYGGTADLVGVLDGEAIVLDYKTGKSIYAETAIQLEAYADLWRANGYLHAVDSDGVELSDEARHARHKHRGIKRSAIIHVPVSGPVSFVEVDAKTRYVSQHLWARLLEMSKYKKDFEKFSKSIAEVVKNDDDSKNANDGKAPF